MTVRKITDFVTLNTVHTILSVDIYGTNLPYLSNFVNK